jgi:hypothetical protein
MATKWGIVLLALGIAAVPATAATIPTAPPASYRIELDGLFGGTFDHPVSASYNGVEDYSAVVEAGPGVAVVNFTAVNANVTGMQAETRYYFYWEGPNVPVPTQVFFGGSIEAVDLMQIRLRPLPSI